MPKSVWGQAIVLCIKVRGGTVWGDKRDQELVGTRVPHQSGGTRLPKGQGATRVPKHLVDKRAQKLGGDKDTQTVRGSKGVPKWEEGRVPKQINIYMRAQELARTGCPNS